MTATHYRTAAEMQDSIEGLLAQHGSQRPWMYWSLLIVTTAALAALPLVKVDTSVGAVGQIRPAVERMQVSPAVGGRIRELHVHDNQCVEEGELLLVLDSAALDARIERNRTETAENDRALSDLASLLANHDPASTASPEEFAVTAEGEDSDAVPLPRPSWSPVPLQSAAYIRQQSLLQSDLQRLHLRWNNAEQELRRFASLNDRGLVTEREYAQKQFNTQAIAQEMGLLIQQTLSRWQSERVERTQRAASLRSETEQLNQQRLLYTVRAPVDGTALGFAGLHTGLYVPAEKPIGEISPSGDLQADVYLSPRDIGFVQVGQSVSLQIDAFPYTEWGTIRGRVRGVSQDFIQIGQQVAFKAVIDLETTRLETADGKTVALRRGMTTQARFILQRRSLFNLLFGKMSEALDPRAAEPTTSSAAGLFPTVSWPTFSLLPLPLCPGLF